MSDHILQWRHMSQVMSRQVLKNKIKKYTTKTVSYQWGKFLKSRDAIIYTGI